MTPVARLKALEERMEDLETDVAICRDQIRSLKRAIRRDLMGQGKALSVLVAVP